MTFKYLLTLILAASGVLIGSEVEFSIVRGVDGKPRQLTIAGTSPGTRLQLFDRAIPVGVIQADGAGNAHFAAALLSPGPHAIQAVEWGTGKKQGPLHRFATSLEPSETFHAAATFATGTRPDVVVAADLEGNGFADLIFFGGNAGSLMRLPNVSGAFGAPVSLATVLNPTAIAVGDFNGDGRNDLAVTMADGRVSVLMNKGNGVFSAPQYFSAGSRPSSIVSADFNSDGIPDLAIANRDGNDLSILIGNGDGTFQPAGSFTAGTTPQSIAAGDFNNDGLADLVTANYGSNDVSLLLGDGKGGFRNAGAFATGNGPTDLSLADFNGDGALDLAVLNQIDGTATVLMNGLSANAGASEFHAIAAIPAVTSLAVGDVNSDGFADLLIQSGTDLWVRHGAGDGSFSGAIRLASMAPSLSLILKDFDRDGHMDAAALDMSGTFALLSGASAVPEIAPKAPVSSPVHSEPATALPRRAQPLITGNTPSSFASFAVSSPLRFGHTVTLTATLTQTNATGAVTFYYGTGVLGTAQLSAGHATLTTLLLASGARNFKAYYAGDPTYLPSVMTLQATFVASTPTTAFGPQVPYNTGGTGNIGGAPKSIALADFNNDGIADMLTANSSGSISVFLGNSDGTFQTAINIPASGIPQFVVTGDFNGDGKADFAAAFHSGTVGIYLGIGDGTFQNNPVSYAGGLQPFAIAAADFNGDGKIDLAVASQGTPSTVSILLGTGTGTFQAAGSPYSVGANPSAIVAGYVNNDQIPDLVTANSSDGSVSVLLGTGSGTFQAAVRIPVGNSPTGLALADLNGDGNLDIAVANTPDNTIGFLAGNGDGTFQPQTLTPVGAGQGPASITVLDLNQDAKADLIVANTNGNSLSIVFGNGNGTFQSPVSFATGVQPSSLVVGDFNSDGVPDLGVANFGSSNGAGGVSVLLGSVLRFVPMSPCRIADTRLATGPFGGPAISGQTTRDFPIPNSTCNIPATAQAYSFNVTVVPQEPLGYLTVWPTGQAQPTTSTLNSDGRIKSNAAIIPAGVNRAISVFASNSTHLVLDINGYFVAASTPSALSFYPVTPCRISDTRLTNGTFGGPYIAGQTTRALPVSSSPSCGIPSTAMAYSLNFTAIPRQNQPLGYLTTWQTGAPQPLASTLNAPTGAITANAAIVPAGTGGSVNIFASNDTDLVTDITGYFAPPGAGGLSYYTLPPCRVLDTRKPTGSQPFSEQLSVPITASACASSTLAQAFAFNATVIPVQTLGYLTLWPQGQTQPRVSTLNADDGKIASNMAIVSSLNGIVNAFASNQTHLVLDIFGYFAP